MHARIASALMLLLAACGGDGGEVAPSDETSAPPARPAELILDAPTYIGSGSCASCHAEAFRLWRGSHHDLAMQEIAEVDTGQMFPGEGPPTLTTDLGPRPVTYAFGVEPLMQFLVAGERGRQQAYAEVYDTRPGDQGGQRWYHLYPDDERLVPGDPFHWSGHQQTWNHQCAECHSTGLVRNYDVASDTYATCWQEIDVGCEACHGPASNHVAWAQGEYGDASDEVEDLGLVNRLTDEVEAQWITDGDTGLPVRRPARDEHREVDTCAACHSLRTPLTDGHLPGDPFLDDYLPSLLTRDRYHADGQIQGEVYVWGSFTQSRMYHQGVTCKDCHDPHSGRLERPGDATCTDCHEAHRYQTQAHHHHAADGPGARCVACHMTHQTYMGIDDRRDHAFRVPRPDLAVELGTPDACSSCHDEGPAWAAERAEEWWGELGGDAGYARAMHAARNRHADAARRLVEVLQDTERPDLQRATAAEELGRIGGDAAQLALEVACLDPSPLLKAAAARALMFAPPTPPRIQLLRDDSRGVRIAAAASLADALPPGMEHEDADVRRAYDEYVAYLGANFEHAWAQVEMARFQAGRGLEDEARATLDRALSRYPGDVPAWSLAADLARLAGNERDAIRILNQGLEQVPGSAELRHALGLAYIRGKSYELAEEQLRIAADATPDSWDFGYVYAICLDHLERRAEAVARIEELRARFPFEREVLITAAQWHHEDGRLDLARDAAAVLRSGFADDGPLMKYLDTLGL